MHVAHTDWHDEILLNLKERNDFSDKILPTWTISVKHLKTLEYLFPYIEASIEILRTSISNEGANNSKSKIYNEQLSMLLEWVFENNLDRFFFHYLMLMRSATIPFSDESIKYFRTNYLESWIKPFSTICENALSHYEGKELGYSPFIFCNPRYTDKQVINFYKNISESIVDFCLNRLKNKNNIIEINSYYHESQLIEPSPIWRMGYLQVLGVMRTEHTSELMNVINLVRKSDPDESVRLIADEIFRTVKYNSSSFKNTDDFYKSIKNAEFILLCTQRKDLQLPIDHYLDPYSDQEDIPF